MSWRIVVIDHKAKLSYKNGYLIVRNEEIKKIHLSEINTIIINSTATVITSYLVNELLSRKIKVVFCDEKRTRIIKEKIYNQAKLLEIEDKDKADMLYSYCDNVKFNDETNREGHSAKVYFNSLFGLQFTRDAKIDVNAALDYGYSIILSQFNREVVAQGCLTQLGIKHRNEFNPFNLSSDLMEPFRPLVDRIVYENMNEVFDGTMKLKLIDVLNHRVHISNSNQYVSNAISLYVKSVVKALKDKDVDEIEFFDYEL